ncbi:hypothetical protein ABTX35_33075 [Streptomyces sp. NPDC096080]
MPELPGLLALIGIGLAVAGCLIVAGLAVRLLTHLIRTARRKAPTV